MSVPRPLPSQATGNEPSHDSVAPDFDTLSEAIRSAGESGNSTVAEQTVFWRALFALPRWRFYCSVQLEEALKDDRGGPAPFIGVVDGVPMLHIFTDDKKAIAFAQNRHRLMGEPQRGITLIEMAPEDAINYLWRLPPQVTKLIVNASFFGAREHLPWLYAISKSITLDEACVRLGINPTDPMSRPDPQPAVRSQAAGEHAPPPDMPSKVDQRVAEKKARVDAQYEALMKWAGADETAGDKPAEPMSLLHRFMGVLVVGAIGYLGWCMVQNPAYSPFATKVGVSKGRVLAQLFDLIWSSAAGYILLVIAGLVMLPLLLAGWKRR